MKDTCGERRLVVRTALGPVEIWWRGRSGTPLVGRIVLPDERRSAGRFRGTGYEAQCCPRIDDLSSRIAAFCGGEAVDFDIDLLDFGACGSFQRSVLLAERAIPRGSVSTYGRIARHIGHSRAARAVGNALARNPFPIVIPCHRAIREGGWIGGFRGGAAMKRRLLELEGVSFTERGLVVMDRVHYNGPPARRAGHAAARRKERA